MRKLLLALLAAALAASVPALAALTWQGDRTDPVRNVALPCEALATPGLTARTNKDIFHVANVCGIVGTDVELQSRKDLAGRVHDYAFVGTMGAGVPHLRRHRSDGADDSRRLRRQRLAERRAGGRRPRRVDLRRRLRRGLVRVDVPEDPLPGGRRAGRRRLPP